MNARKVVRGSVRGAVAVLVAACASAPPGPAHELTGMWVGGIEADGQPIDGTLRITQTGWDLEVEFASPSIGIRAGGTGTVTDEGEVAMELSYNIECPGTAVLSGTITEGGTRLSGGLSAADCTGNTGGSFSFTRR